MMTVRQAIISGFSLALAGTALPTLADEPLPTIIQQFTQSGAQVAELPARHGLRGFLISKGNSKQTFYLTPDETAMVAGMMFDTERRSITAAQLQQLAEENPAKLPGARTMSIKSIIKSSHGFKVGFGEQPNMIVFADPLCPHCEDFWRAAQPALMSGRLTVYAVPVGVTNSSTARTVAAQLLDTPDPAASWIKYTAGAMRLSTAPSSAALKKISENNKLFFKLGFTMTPSFGFIAGDKSVAVLNDGMPYHFLDKLKSLK